MLVQTQCFDRIKMLTLLPPPSVQRPKIAFLFIARNRLPLDMVWDAFFKVILVLTTFLLKAYLSLFFRGILRSIYLKWPSTD